jgi:hypothetical protein
MMPVHIVLMSLRLGGLCLVFASEARQSRFFVSHTATRGLLRRYQSSQ